MKPAEQTDSTGPCRPAGLAVAALCVVTLLAKLWINAPRTNVAHGDVSNYFLIARNLAEGRGFVIDYIWNFWNEPSGIPTPSNIWWMPLPSVICAVGMRLFGTTYVVAQQTMIVVTSLLPWAIYLLGRELFGGRRIPLVGATLAATCHLVFDQVCAPLSHGPYLLAATLALWLILRSTRDLRSLPWTGAAIALAQLSRSDGVLLFATLICAHLLMRRRPKALPWLLVPVTYALVMSPWWAHNLAVHGALQPGGAFRAVYMSTYEQWYSLPESVTRERWLAQGWEPVIDLKLRTAERNLSTAATGLVTGSTDRGSIWDEEELVTVLVLSWIGVLIALSRRELRRRFLTIVVQAAVVFGFYTVVFTAVGTASFRTGMYSVYPGLLLAAAAALDMFVRVGSRLLARTGAPTRRVSRLPEIALVLVLAWLGWGQVTSSRDWMQRKGAGIDRMGALYDALGGAAVRRVLGPDPVIMARDVHELAALTGYRCVAIPYEPEPVIRKIAIRYGVTHMLLFGDPAKQPPRPGLRAIATNPAWKKVIGPSTIAGVRVQVYELLKR